MDPERDRPLLAAATEIAERAGALVVDLRRGDMDVRDKADGSPVTDADERAEELILARLAEQDPGVPAIGEETAAREEAGNAVPEVFWLIDPIDGTKAFVAGSDEFTVNVALVRNGVPVLGVVAAPALGVTYRACGPGTAEARPSGGRWRRIAARRPSADGAVLLSSRSFGDRGLLDPLIGGAPVREHRLHDSSIKFCMVARGEADLYPRYGPSREWDTAAGHAILLGAGGTVRITGGRPLTYGKAGWRNPEFVARGRE